MQAPLSKERQKYFALMALVCEDLSPSATKAIDQMVRDGHVASSAQLTAVRNGRSPNLHWLIDLVRASLPDFPIPDELLPVPATPAQVAAPQLAL
jgi:hypothetical protein